MLIIVNMDEKDLICMGVPEYFQPSSNPWVINYFKINKVPRKCKELYVVLLKGQLNVQAQGELYIIFIWI